MKLGSPLQTNGIQELAAARPDLLVAIMRDNFLPPAQIAYCINALEDNVLDQDLLTVWLTQFLEYPSLSVREAASAALKLTKPVA